MKNPLIMLFTLIYLLPLCVLNSQTNKKSIPDWFLKTENYNQENMAIGISEPNSDTTHALEQAKLNALINHSIIHNAEFSSLTNVGMGSQQDNSSPSSTLEYILYTSIIKGKLIPDSAVSIKERFFTNYKEAIVLIEINPDFKANSQLTDYTVTRSAGFHMENNLFPLFIDELEILVKRNDSILLSYAIEKNGPEIKELKKEQKKKLFDDVANKKSAYKYPEFGNNQSKFPVMPTPLGYGMLKSYIFNLIDQICLYNSMDINCQYKLSSTNIGNLNKQSQSFSFQQLVYSLKNVQFIMPKPKVASISISKNNLNLAIKSGKIDVSSIAPKAPDKADYKQLKSMVSENWNYLGEDDFETGWLKSLNISTLGDKYLNTEVEIQASSLHSGILEGLQLAKLQLSSQLATKIEALGKANVATSEVLAIQSAKLINVEKTGNIGPLFIFYQNASLNHYNIKLKVLYDLGQLYDL